MMERISVANAFSIGLSRVVRGPIFGCPVQIGRGEKTIHSLHRRIGTSKYMPHQGKRECERRRRQLAAKHPEAT